MDSSHVDAVRLIPLGGLGEIGMNCLAIEDAEGIIVIDCGITFPQHDLGVDTYHPVLTYLEERRDRVRGVFLTHGHEDHVGALAYLLGRCNVPVYGSRHALAVARHRIEERGFGLRCDYRPMSPRSRYSAGSFVVEPIAVTHSIVESYALAIETRRGTIVHSGDFKFDATPPGGVRTDEARLSELGDRGVSLLLSDSTNVDSHGPHASEAEVARTLEALVQGATGRVIVGLFASNLVRMGALGEIAARQGRKIVLLGRSVQLQSEWGRDLGHLSWPSDLVVRGEDAALLPRERILALAGGTQAEPGSALARLSQRAHPLLTLDRGDTVVFSSRVIPGNEPKVMDLMSSFLRQGITVRNWLTDPLVHVSGHAHRDEQRHMIDLVRPSAFLPVHGTRHHLERHAELAAEAGVQRRLVLENGEVGSLWSNDFLADGKVPSGRVATWAGHEIGERVLEERRGLGRAGVAHVTLVVDARGSLRAPPQVVARGIVDLREEAELLRRVALEISKGLEQRPFAEDRPSEETLSEAVRRSARRVFQTVTGKKPTTLVTIVRV